MDKAEISLFAGDNDDGKKAKAMLEEASIAFDFFDDTGAPTLLTGTGDIIRGIAAIQDFIRKWKSKH